jgi:tetratricopeptide (TPR) repeat protein
MGKSIFLGATLLTLTASPASAQQPTAATTSVAPGAASSGSTQPTAGPELTTEQLSNMAYEAYQKERFSDAISLYLKAFQASGENVILFNLAKIYDQKLHERGLAREYYERYLKTPSPDPALALKANERLRVLREAEETLAKNKGLAPRAPSEASSQSSKPTEVSGGISALKVVGLVTAGVGLVGLGVGTAFGLSASSKNSDAKAICPNDQCIEQRGVDLTTSARSAAQLSTVFFVAGGALTVTGLLLFLVAPSGSSKAKTGQGQRPSVSPQVAPGHLGFSFSGGF